MQKQEREERERESLFFGGMKEELPRRKIAAQYRKGFRNPPANLSQTFLFLQLCLLRHTVLVGRHMKGFIDLIWQLCFCFVSYREGWHSSFLSLHTLYSTYCLLEVPTLLLFLLPGAKWGQKAAVDYTYSVFGIGREGGGVKQAVREGLDIYGPSNPEVREWWGEEGRGGGGPSQSLWARRWRLVGKREERGRRGHVHSCQGEESLYPILFVQQLANQHSRFLFTHVTQAWSHR